MKSGTENTSKTRTGDREIISVSIPVSVYEQMQEYCTKYCLNRSAMFTVAITKYLESMGVVMDGLS